MVKKSINLENADYFVSLHVERKMSNCNPRKKNGRKQRRKKDKM